MKKRLLMIVFATALLPAILLSSCRSVQYMLQGTPTFTQTSTQTPSPTYTPTSTITLTPTNTPTPTVTPNLAATQQYETFLSLVQQYYDAGQVSTMNGKYYRLDDYSDELAMSYGFSWIPTGVRARNFIIRAEFDWEVANEINNSGCGYIFRYWDEKDYALIALDAHHGTFLSFAEYKNDIYGNFSVVYTKIGPIKKEIMPEIGQNPYHAIFTLIVNGSSIYTYVNDEFFSEYRLSEEFPSSSGDLASMVLTGSINDFGTRCNITNAEAWIIST